MVYLIGLSYIPTEKTSQNFILIFPLVYILQTLEKELFYGRSKAKQNKNAKNAKLNEQNLDRRKMERNKGRKEKKKIKKENKTL